ncbi:hydrolase [Ruania alkalisoli]|uniref:Hydrolase n=1 Tax=Ruania alkalisoli TaxID=2779775 RepID=A0A7M1SRW5_9MICO|nr:nitrilase-related carbon-nitrogen hydrolase [Ruania alkalisoli]QOR69887.1 hydrolase [Ruania alkalisoli]
MRVAVVQLSADDDRGQNTRAALARVRAAAEAGARLIVLPEYTSGWSRRLRADLGEDPGGEFHEAISQVAAERHVTVIVGALEPSSQEGRCVNVTLVYGPDGAVSGRYEKVHLFDAFGVRESEVLDPGAPGQAAVVEVDGMSVGIATCYDLRFPESFRLLADAGAQVFAVGAAWADGPGKADQLEVLVRARAIENTAYVLLASQDGRGRSGHSQVVDPVGRPIARAGDESAPDGVIVADLDPELLARVRDQVPSLAHRKYAVVPRA